MISISPELSEEQLDELPSQAEAKVYRAFRDNLPKEYSVFFQVGWILRREDEQAKDGETDFLICHPDYGYLCVEVKGGGIGFDANTDQWYSIDRNRRKHNIKNPITQALRAKYSIRTKLSEAPQRRGLDTRNILRGHTVFFPDIGTSKGVERPDMPAQLIGTADTLKNPKEWIDAAFKYWGKDVGKFATIGRSGIDIFHEIFARSFAVSPIASSRLADQEAKRLELTNDQMRVLDFLRAHRRAAISGGAGTGKTVLAVEKARRLASEGFKTLLTCYNRPLADHLSTLCSEVDNLDVFGFHQLCYRQVEMATKISGRDLAAEAKVTYPGKGYYDVQLPNALAYSLEILPARYDAIVCDEGQDFREEYWVPLELLLNDLDQSPLYVFYDDNQNIYTRTSTFPIRDDPFTLSANCRNTAPIHTAAYNYYKGLPTEPPTIEGDEVLFTESSRIKSQAARINAQIVDLIDRQGVVAGDIVVLIADARHKDDYYAMLRQLPLPKPAMWLEEGVQDDSTVLVDTVHRFKGLESPVVILWGLDTIDFAQHHELLYVGMSRANSLLTIIGAAGTCAAISEEIHRERSG